MSEINGNGGRPDPAVVRAIVRRYVSVQSALAVFWLAAALFLFFSKVRWNEGMMPTVLALALLVSAIGFYMSLVAMLRALRLNRRGREVTAEVKTLQIPPMSGAARADYEYQAGDGRTYGGRVMIDQAEVGDFQPGSKIEVVYDTLRPRVSLLRREVFPPPSTGSRIDWRYMLLAALFMVLLTGYLAYRLDRAEGQPTPASLSYGEATLRRLLGKWGVAAVGVAASLLLAFAGLKLRPRADQ